MSTNQDMTHEEVIAYQDSVVETAKAILQKEGAMLPMVFVLTRKEPDPWLMKTVLDTKTWESPTEDADKGKRLILMIPAPYDNAHFLLKYIEYLSDSPEASTKQIEVLRQYGRLFFNLAKSPEEMIVETFKKLFKTDGKDIIAAFVSKVCKTTEAQAYVKVSEAWTLAEKVAPGTKMTPELAKEARKKFPKDFADDPDAKEVLMSMMETRNLRRQVIWPFERFEPRKGPIVRWGERVVREDDGSDEGRRIEGRFFGLLQGNLH